MLISGHRGVGKLVSVRHASLLLPALNLVEKMATNTRDKRRHLTPSIHISIHIIFNFWSMYSTLNPNIVSISCNKYRLIFSEKDIRRSSNKVTSHN
jgi:hypothetical protein